MKKHHKPGGQEARRKSQQKQSRKARPRAAAESPPPGGPVTLRFHSASGEGCAEVELPAAAYERLQALARAGGVPLQTVVEAGIREHLAQLEASVPSTVALNLTAAEKARLAVFSRMSGCTVEELANASIRGKLDALEGDSDASARCPACRCTVQFFAGHAPDAHVADVECPHCHKVELPFSTRVIPPAGEGRGT